MSSPDNSSARSIEEADTSTPPEAVSEAARGEEAEEILKISFGIVMYAFVVLFATASIFCVILSSSLDGAVISQNLITAAKLFAGMSGLFKLAHTTTKQVDRFVRFVSE